MLKPKWGGYRPPVLKTESGKKRINKDPAPQIPAYLIKGKTYECDVNTLLDCSVNITPPSINNYWLDSGRASKRLSKRANHFIEVMQRFVQPHNYMGDVQVIIDYHMPDKKVRDIDNILKPCLDALTKCGLIGDDSQVKSLLVNARPIVAGGQIDIQVRKHNTGA
ncbi:RusA family crossover junction endodeoxyribonuclease [Acinetobacter pittii]|uniref:RusA family crossover junction endodeoxyribonuclease n=1 Tax=Acinetobacter pittii TaxID=48296 RepID=UPI000CE4DF2F|nr:RusA family crossover junction endodeoxyribonuclease [Acinetobacter pittii]PPC02501.1 hypothetical protein ApiMCR53_05850 [Acinetobacter pittii]WPP78271.1 RusA family crossover junction endodeoxyribonuclease [Acinetobacter pittii]